jgi:hypothetical protein
MSTDDTDHGETIETAATWSAVRYLLHARLGDVAEAAREIGVSAATLARWLREDPSLAEGLERHDEG